jgi:hypothetical protein
MRNELERIWEEAVVALSWRHQGSKTTNISARIGSLQAKN